MVFKLPLGFNSVFVGPVLILSFMNVFVLAILIYLFYRFVSGFLIPLFRASRHMRQQFHHMNQQANGQADNPSNPGPKPGTNGQPGKTPKSGVSKVGEYIDFEEVK